MNDWRPYPLLPESTVTGTLLQMDDVPSPQLGNRRPLLAWLPPSHRDGGRRYPVVYMHDGQNLFDAATSYAGEWRVDESMTALAAEGIEAIVVGLQNGGQDRALEYTPYPNAEYGTGGRARDYVAFLADTVKPLVDATLPTLPGREHTTVAGSSLGGLVSLYALLERPEVFSAAGVFSPAFWWTGERFLADVERHEKLAARIYMDVGGRENPENPERSRAYVDDFKRVAAILKHVGYGEQDLKLVFDPEAPHHESAWAERFPDAMHFLLAPR